MISNDDVNKMDIGSKLYLTNDDLLNPILLKHKNCNFENLYCYNGIVYTIKRDNKYFEVINKTHTF